MEQWRVALVYGSVVPLISLCVQSLVIKYTKVQDGSSLLVS